MTKQLSILMASTFFIWGAYPSLAADKNEGALTARSIYGGLSVGPEVFVLDLQDGNTENLITNTFFGVGGTAQLCKQGIGSASFIDLCAGAHAFQSLGNGAEQTTVLGVPLESEAEIFTFGGFVQGKLNAGAFYVGPYAGARRISADINLNGFALSDLEDTSENAIFLGSEIGFNAFNQRLNFGISGEIGTALGADSINDFNYYRANAFVRVKF